MVSSRVSRSVYTRCYALQMGREISVRELRNRTADVVSAVRSGEQVTLTVNRMPVADIAPHRRERSPWVPSSTLVEIVTEGGVDHGIMDDLADVRGDRIG